MANILFVSGSYFPYATANAVCAKKFEDALKKQGHQVLYCNRKHDLYEPDTHTVDGTEIHTVGKNSDLFFQTVEKLKTLELPGVMRRSFAQSLKLYRLLVKIRQIGKSKAEVRRIAREQYLKSYAKAIAALVREKRIDLIVSVSMPFDSHAAVLRAMDLLSGESKPKWIAYCIDAYWSKAGVPEKEIPEMKKEELSVFCACDRVLFLDTIEKDYSGTAYDAVREKFCSLPLPLFDPEAPAAYSDGITPEEGVVDIVFTGTIYDDYRNTDLFVSVAENLKGEKVRFHFLGKIYPKSLAQLENLRQAMPGQILLYGRMPYDYAKGSIQRADILLNLANDNANQIPSKIFEYMMCKKPILNLYKVEQDVGTKYLKQYPLSCHICGEQDPANAKGKLLEWFAKVKREQITNAQLTDIFHDIMTPVVTARFCESVKELLNRG